MTNEKTVDVQIPEELAHYVMSESEECGRYLTKRKKGNQTRRLAKSCGFYLLLKAEAPESGWIKDYVKQIPELAYNFGISSRTFYTYISQLEKLKIAFREGNDIRIVGWVELGNVLEISTKKRITIKFNYDRKQQIHRWFAAIEIMSNQDRQRYMIWKKVTQNSGILDELLPALVKRGFDTTNLNNPEYLAGHLMNLYIEDFQTGTEVHNILIHIRADVNRSCKKIGKAWDMSPQLVSYWKQQMSAQRVINISKVKILSDWTRETKECHKNKFCHVVWDPKLKERLWVLCDQLTVLMPWKWQEFLENETAKKACLAA